MKNVWLFSLSIFVFALAFTSCDDEEQTIPLPAIIQSYLDTNYPDAEVEESEQETLCDGTEVYEVEVEMADDEEIELTFDTEGNLLFTESEIPTSELPAAVTTTISTDYADYSIEEAEVLDMADDSKQYEVELKNGATQLEVLFSADGTVICEEEDDDE